MAKAAAISFKEFRTRYQTEDACREELFRQRFPEGFVCPKCGCKEFHSIHSRSICQCRSCRHQTSVTAGTVMHRTHLPLTIWFWAIYLCVTDKRGISAVQLSRTLGVSYDSAWHLLDRIRKAMGRQRDEHYKLSSIVEMDNYFVGGPSHDGKRGRGTDKAKAVAAITLQSRPKWSAMGIKAAMAWRMLKSTIAPTKLVICIGFIQQSVISKPFCWAPIMADVFICKATWMSSAFASIEELPEISCFRASPGLLLHLVPCCVKLISIKYYNQMIGHKDRLNLAQLGKFGLA